LRIEILAKMDTSADYSHYSLAFINSDIVIK